MQLNVAISGWSFIFARSALELKSLRVCKTALDPNHASFAGNFNSLQDLDSQMYHYDRYIDTTDNSRGRGVVVIKTTAPDRHGHDPVTDNAISCSITLGSDKVDAPGSDVASDGCGSDLGGKLSSRTVRQPLEALYNIILAFSRVTWPQCRA